MSTSGAKPGKTTFATYKVKAGAVIVKGVGVYLSAADEVDVATANSKSIGVATESVTGNSSGTSRLEVAVADGGSVAVKASGTVTRGEFLIAGTGGFENQTIGGGTTVKYLIGQALESGVTGDFVECSLGRFAAGCA